MKATNSRFPAAFLLAAALLDPAGARARAEGVAKPPAADASKPAAEATKPAADAPKPAAAGAKKLSAADLARSLAELLDAGAGGADPVPPPEPEGARGKLEAPERLFDAGTVDRGAIISHDFELRNIGNGTLTVDARPGCGCTVVAFDKTIPPGGVGKVTAKLRTSEFKSDIVKGIKILTDDAENAELTLEIKAHVQVPVEAVPEVVVIDAKAGRIAPVTVTVTGTGGDPFDIVSATWTDSRFAAAIVPVMVAEDGKPAPKAPKPNPGTLASGSRIYEVIIRPAVDIPIGRFQSTLILATTHPKAATLPINVFATIRGSIDVSSDQVSLRVGPGARAPEATQRVVIRKAKPEGRALAIASVSTSVPELKAALRTTVEGQEYDLEIRFDGPTPLGILTESVTLKTNDSKQSEIVIVVNIVPVPAAEPPPTPARAKAK